MEKIFQRIKGYYTSLAIKGSFLNNNNDKLGYFFHETYLSIRLC